MIPPAFLTDWAQVVPWNSSAQVEQDLVLSRALLDLFRHDLLRDNLVFRGGTALHKLVLQPAARYSEDLDFVQIRPEPIGPVLDAIRETLSPWLGEPRRSVSPMGATLNFRFESELPPVLRLRLKIEINTREHGSRLPLITHPFRLDSRWVRGETTLRVYDPVELLGTKLRALYQRRKGRDLFDLWHAHQSGLFRPGAVLDVFHAYMNQEGHSIRREDFQSNLATKLNHSGFLSDTDTLLRPGITYDPHIAADWLQETLLSKI